MQIREVRSECVRSHLFFKLNLNPPSFHLILITPPPRPMPAPAFFLPLMKCFSPHTFPYLLIAPVLSPPFFPPPQVIVRLSLTLIVFGFLSVILLGKVIKGQHIEGALLRCVILFSGAHLFVSYFCLRQQTLSGGSGGLGAR